MSRLADAESKLAGALDALEAAISAGRTAGDASIHGDGAGDGAGAGPDSAMIISEIGRIDAQLAHAMELIADIRRGVAAEEGNA